MFNAQKNENRRIKACQYACHIQQQNWPKWNVSWPQTQSSLLLLQAPGSATHNAFYNSGEVGIGSMTPAISGVRDYSSSNSASQKSHMQLTSMKQQNENQITARQGRSSLYRNNGISGSQGGQRPRQNSKLFQQPGLQTSRPGALPDTTKQIKLGTQPINNIILDFRKAEVDGLGDNSNSQTTPPSITAKQTSFQQEGNTDHNWSVQWQNDSSENQIPETSPRGVQGTLQERSRLPPVQPADANNSVKPRSTVSPLSQTSKPALPTP
ncbi:hypothetical protein FOMG_17960 [Fusarium oxysporum f. sp. melonis 26406]|uniref:Uncharacterized protein n=1 Tax=Fusarium oxysporum f. sp. melonis 26406 TaxID=1089452 RepID=W9ZAT2_FUSOX|nr:hypothetical protein FOMG_17960 [Fusarium oxysporum f. sp. melonis 26406]